MYIQYLYRETPGQSKETSASVSTSSTQPETIDPKTKRSTRPLRSVVMGGYAVFAVVIIFAAGLFSFQAGASGDDLRSKLTIIAPASPGGGWDTFAREQQQAMRANQLVNSVQVVNIPGAGGTIGLGKLSTLTGQANTLMVGGTGLMAAEIQHRSPISVSEMTPIARVVAEYNVIVVPGDSPYQSIEDLVRAWVADPQGVVWTGGGSFDQLVMTATALAAGVEPMDTAYVPASGGGEVAQALMNGTAQVAASGYADLSDQIESGRLRALGLAAPERMADSDIPVLREAGLDVTLSNWRALFAPPNISAEEQAELLKLVKETVVTPEWEAAIPRYQWTEVFLNGSDLEIFLNQEDERIRSLYEEMGR